MCPEFHVGYTSSSSSAFPAIFLGFTILGEIFAYVIVCLFVLFVCPTTEVVTFRLRRWCVLGTFLLSAFFTRLGPECQDLLIRPMQRMCVQTRPRFILSSERVWRELSQKPC